MDDAFIAPGCGETTAVCHREKIRSNLMKFTYQKSLLLAATIHLSATCGFGQFQLTDVVVFSTTASGTWTTPDTWETRPGGNYNVWVQSVGSGLFLNGPADSAVRPNFVVPGGNSAFRLFGAPGLDASYFGVNLFFNGSSTPSISAFGPMSTSTGAHTFAANSATQTPKTIPGPLTGYVFPGAGTLSFTQGGQTITLTDFFWAKQSVYGLDLTGPSSVGADGTLDYVGGISFSIVPEPQVSVLLLAGLAQTLLRKFRVSRR